MRSVPSEERLQNSQFQEYHAQAWDDNSGAEFRDTMLEEYPELEDFLIEGNETNKGEWTDAYGRFLNDLPEDIETTLKPAPFPQGIDQDPLNNLFPLTIYIPPVKEISDATRTSNRAEFGKLIQELASEIETEMDEMLEQAMEEVHRELNVIEEDGEEIDDRHEGVRAIEHTISNYLKETFDDHDVDLRFPPPESISIIKNAEIWIEEEGFTPHEIENQGEGVKRILIFSLIRTLADLRQGEIDIGDDNDNSDLREPMMILFEEAELFLHPSLQQIMLNAFHDLVASGDQVIFTTHSPFLVKNSLLNSINFVEKQSGEGTQTTSFDSVLEEREIRQQQELLDVQGLSSYLFAEKVLLVEGKSDKIIIEKLAEFLDRDWNFQGAGIPIIPVYSKYKLSMFRDALMDLGIEVYVVTDQDFILDGFNRMFEEGEITERRSELMNELEEAKEDWIEEVNINRDTMEKIESSYDWEDVFEQFSKLKEKLEKNQNHSEEDIACLERFTRFKEERAERLALKYDEDLHEQKNEFIKSLLGENVLILDGELEDYYPDSHSNKIESALEFQPEEFPDDQLLDNFNSLEIEVETKTDLEILFEEIFENS